MQYELEKLVSYASENEMIINHDKTKAILFNNRKKYDFLPELSLNSEENIEVVEEVKLLGVIIRSDLNWSGNTDNICRKAYMRMWILRRLKNLGAVEEELLDVYRKQILTVIEFSAPVWTPGLTQNQIHQIERVQKTAIHIILGDQYSSYKEGLKQLKIDTLGERRQIICKKFTLKATQHEKFSSWFKKQNPTHDNRTRSIKNKYKCVNTRTNKFKKSPIPYFTEIANSLK